MYIGLKINISWCHGEHVLEKGWEKQYSPHNVSILWALKNYFVHIVKSSKIHELPGDSPPPPHRAFALDPIGTLSGPQTPRRIVHFKMAQPRPRLDTVDDLYYELSHDILRWLPIRKKIRSNIHSECAALLVMTCRTKWTTILTDFHIIKKWQKLQMISVTLKYIGPCCKIRFW